MAQVAEGSTEGYCAGCIPRLEDFHISDKTGFLIEHPLVELPTYFEPWNDLGRRLSTLLAEHALRDAVEKMPLLDHELLSGHRQWRLAHTILSFIGHGYVWQEGETQPAKKLPRQLAVPWYEVSIHLGLRPSLCQANGVLSNWRLIDPTKKPSLDNMRLICSLPGGINCQWFFLITAEIEKDIVPGLLAILKAKESILSGDSSSLRQSLDEITENLRHLKSISKRIHENLDSNIFYNVIRPFLLGWGGNSRYMPEGLIFEGVSDVPLTVSGGSAAQSSTIQCFDAALGITHQPDKQDFLNNMRTYMPPAHTRFIVALGEAPSIRDYVSCCQDNAVIEAYQRCVSALVDFRSYHFQIVTKYVISKSATVLGTGGTELASFLKGTRDTTSAALSLNSQSTSSK